MRNIVRWVLCGALALGFSGAAVADVFVTAEITKDKDVFVNENIQITKDVFINVFVDADPDGAAEAQAIVNATNVGNVSDSLGEVAAFGVQLDTEITDSVNDNSGIAGVNVNTGSNVNQGNLVSLATTQSATAFTNAQAEVDQENSSNFSRQIEDIVVEDVVGVDPLDAPTDASVVIGGSVMSNSGIVGVNANAGFNNNQHNAVALAVGPGGLVALSESALGQVNSNNTIDAFEVVKANKITGSINGNSGHTHVNATAGSNNNQANASSFAVLTSSVSVNVPGSDL